MAITPSNIYLIAPQLIPGSPQTQTITFSAPLIAGNVITGSISGYTFSIPFTVDMATTLNAFTARLALFPPVGSATNNGLLLVTVTGAMNGITLPLTVAVTGPGGITATIETTVYARAGQTTLAEVVNAINQAAAMMNACTWGLLYDLGQTYLAAHLLSMGGSSGRTGLASQTLGQESESYLTIRSVKDQAYYLTSYGTQYLALRDMLFITPIVGYNRDCLPPDFPFVVGC